MKKLASSLLLVACVQNAPDQPQDPYRGGTDTGNPNDGHGTAGEVGGLCDQSERPLALDEATPLGVSAAELFQWLAGAHHETLAWQDQSASFGPEHGQSEITLEIEPLGAHFVDRSPATQSSGAGLAIAEIGTVGDPCADSLTLDVRLHLSTSGGALNETIETTLEAKARDFVSGHVQLPTDMLTGSFVADVAVPNGFVASGAPKLSLDLGLSQYGDQGQFTLLSEFRSNDGQAVGQGGGGIVARFPAGDTCESGSIGVSSTESVRGVSMDAVLQSLNGSSPARLDGSTATLELTFASSSQRLCVQLGAGADSTLAFPGRVTLRSSDQRIDGSIDVTLSGAATGGVLEHSGAVANDFLLDRAQASAARLRYAITQPLDFSSYDGGAFEFSTDVTETGAVGALRAYGLDQAECVTNPQPVDPNAQSTPGCRGTDRIAIWSASWSKR
jgi:hypothetical protein